MAFGKTTCVRCGAPLSGAKGWRIMPLCPACELVKNQEEAEKKRREREREARREAEREERRRLQEDYRREQEEHRRAREARREAEKKAEWARREAEAHAERLENLEQQRIKAVEKQTYELKCQEERHHNEMLQQQKDLEDRKIAFLQEEELFEKAKPHCKWCGRTYQFNNNEGFFEYCSKKCASDDLSRENFKVYIESAPAIMEKIISSAIKKHNNLQALILSECPIEFSDKLTMQLIELFKSERNHCIDHARADLLLKGLVKKGNDNAIKKFIDNGKYRLLLKLNSSPETVQKILKFVNDLLIIEKIESALSDYYSPKEYKQYAELICRRRAEIKEQKMAESYQFFCEKFALAQEKKDLSALSKTIENLASAHYKDSEAFYLQFMVKFEALKKKDEIQKLQTSLAKGKNVALILTKYPDLEPYCSWQQMNSKELTAVLLTFPGNLQYRKNCNFKKIENDDWNRLLSTDDLFFKKIHKLLQDKKLHDFLKNGQELSEDIDLNHISGDSWLHLMAYSAQYAKKCNWAKVVEFVKSLPPADQNSVKKTCPELINNSKEIIFYGKEEIPLLSADDFFILMDFLDCEHCIDFKSFDMSFRDFYKILKKHPEFEIEYDWQSLNVNDRLWFALLHTKHFLSHFDWSDISAEKILEFNFTGIPVELLDLFGKNINVLKLIGFSILSSSDKVYMAVHFPDFISAYGVSNFTKEEIIQILKENPDAIRPYSKGLVFLNNLGVSDSILGSYVQTSQKISSLFSEKLDSD